MSHYLHTTKLLVASLIFVPLFSFGSVASAAEVFGTNDAAEIATCTTGAIAAGLATSAITLATQTATVGTAATAVTTASGLQTALSVPVADIVGNETLGTISGLNAAHTAFQDIGKMDLDSLAYGVAQCTLTQLTNNTVKWIQGGFSSGGPKFAVDTRALFEDIAKGVTADFANQIRGLQTCDFTPNFNLDLANSVQLSVPKNNKFPAKVACPFGAQNVSASQFYNDFSTAGWRGLASALNDSGNQFGVSVLTAQESQRRQQEVKQKEDQKLSWSNGFTDIIDTDNCTYPPEIAENASAMTQEDWAFYQREYCKTTTPGKIVGDSLMKAIGAETDRIGFADNMNKIISALINQLTKQAVTGLFTSANNALSNGGGATNSNPGNTGGNTTSTGSTPTGTAPYVSNGTVAYTSNTATLSGSILYPDLSGTAWFVWTTSATEILSPAGNSTPPYTYTAYLGAQTGYTAQLSGLTPNTKYYFRAVGQTSQGLWYGAPQSFTTYQ